MKVRQGFVSNSSSSSFMIALAFINDPTKAKNFFDKYKTIENGWCEIISSEEAKKLAYGPVNHHILSFNSYKFYLLATNRDYCVSLDYRKRTEIWENLPIHEQAKNLLGQVGTPIGYLYIMNDEGDGRFWDEEADDLDYNIGLDFFSEEQRKCYEGFIPENGLIFIDKMFGAARNG